MPIRTKRAVFISSKILALFHITELFPRKGGILSEMHHAKTMPYQNAMHLGSVRLIC